MLKKPSHPSPVNDREIQRILDRVDRQEPQNDPGRNRRADVRYSYRHVPIKVHVTQPGGGVFDIGVAGRELSAGGMSFLYRGFLHAGTSIRLTLTRRAGGHEHVESNVVWCRHIVGPHHLVGVKFRERIAPKLFVESAMCEADGGPPVDISRIKGSLLLIDDQEPDRMLFEHHLKGTAIKVTCVGNSDSALTAARQGTFDVVLCDLNLGSTCGEDLIRALRSAGYANPILALTGEASDERIQRAQAAGAQSVVLKPYDPKLLLAMIASVLEGVADARASEPIHSDLAGNPGADALILQCIQKVQALTGDLRFAIDANDFGRVRTLVQALKSNGGGFGFSALSDAARVTIDMLDAQKAVQAAAEELRRLEAICNRLAPGKAPPSK